MCVPDCAFTHRKDKQMRAGGDKRGNNKDRKRRKEWLLSEFGDGETCNCVHCGKPLDINTVEADRKIPGASYARWNIQPADRHCNASRSNKLDWISPLQLQTV